MLTSYWLSIAGVISLLAGLLSGGQFLSADDLAQQTLAMKLSTLGYYEQATTEDVDDSMHMAIENFQIANELKVTGELDAATEEKLGSEDAVSKGEYLSLLMDRYAGIELSVGVTGQEVSRLQGALFDLGFYSGKADGVFGVATGDAVKLFQQGNALPMTGIADASVLFRLYEGNAVSQEHYLDAMCAKRSDSGANVKNGQIRLKELGFYNGVCTGSYGDLTVSAVQQFQLVNDLESSGEINLQTCIKLYSLSPVQVQQNPAMKQGDTGDDVRALQEKMIQLGYCFSNANDVYDDDLVTAVCLFQIANSLEPTGEADQQMQDLINSEKALSASDAHVALFSSHQGVSAEVLQAICENAVTDLGQPFAGNEKSLFPGFGYVQYVFALHGVGFMEPGEIVGEPGELVRSGTDLPSGAIVALEQVNELGIQMQLAVSVGDGRLVFSSAKQPWVVSGTLDQMEYQNAYVWEFGATND